MELFDISIIVLLAPTLMKATSRHCLYHLVNLVQSEKCFAAVASFATLKLVSVSLQKNKGGLK